MLTWSDIADLYEEHVGGRARILPLQKVLDTLLARGIVKEGTDGSYYPIDKLHRLRVEVSDVRVAITVWGEDFPDIKHRAALIASTYQLGAGAGPSHVKHHISDGELRMTGTFTYLIPAGHYARIREDLEQL